MAGKLTMTAHTPLATWFPDRPSLLGVARRRPRVATVFPPLDRGFRALVPSFEEVLAMASSGLPVHVAANRKTDPRPTARRVRAAAASGDTIYLPQAHQVLPRVMRLIAAMRSGILGPFREARSFLFAVEGRGRIGMGLHHDGDVESFWIQIEGRRTVTVGPPAPPDLPEDADEAEMESRGGRSFRTFPLDPGSLLYLPPRALHRVVCFERSLAISLTFAPADRTEALHALVDIAPPSGPLEHAGAESKAFPRGLAAAANELAQAARRADLASHVRAQGLVEWDVVPGTVTTMPRKSRKQLFTQVPAVAGPLDRRRGDFPMWIDGGEIRLPGRCRRMAAGLEIMPTIDRPGGAAGRDALGPLLDAGILAPEEIPLQIVPDDLDSLDGWDFA